jgi:hypothetical protein
MNARYRHRSASRETARLAAVNDLRYLLGLYRSEKFIFDTPLEFPERHGGIELVLDLAQGGSCSLTLANGSIGTDVVELAPGTYRQASRQMQGSHLFGVDGEGYTLVWEEDVRDFNRTDWRNGIIYAPPGMAFHQHFNAGAVPARFVDVQLGSLHYPMFRQRRAAYGDSAVYASGSATISFSEQDPCIHKMWLDAIAGKGVTPRMPAAN